VALFTSSLLCALTAGRPAPTAPAHLVLALAASSLPFPRLSALACRLRPRVLLQRYDMAFDRRGELHGQLSWATSRGDEAACSVLRSQLADVDLEIDRLERDARGTGDGGGARGAHNPLLRQRKGGAQARTDP